MYFMKNKIFSGFILIFLMYSNNGRSQNFDWALHYQTSYSFNPTYINSPLALSGNVDILTCRLDSFSLHYNLSVLGTYILEKRSNSGSLIWQFSIGRKASIIKTVFDNQGNIYAGGLFMDTVIFNQSDYLENTGSGFNINAFLIKLDPSGNLLWKKNLELQHGLHNFEDIQTGPGDKIWYAINDFNNSTLYALDANGHLADSIHFQGISILGNFCFDIYGNLFFSGSTDSGTASILNQNYIVTHTYNQFIGRINAHRTDIWVHFAHDITFQKPRVVADRFGNAYMCGMLFDSASFGNMHFRAPDFSLEFYVFKADSTGFIQWGQANPAAAGLATGRIEISDQDVISTDYAGNVYIGGVVAGKVDWGGGQILIADSGQFWAKRLAVFSFDTQGNYRTGNTFGSNTYGNMLSLKADSIGNLYFSCGVRDTSLFGPYTFYGNTDISFVFGKISMLGTYTTLPHESIQSYPYPNPTSGKIRFVPEIDSGELKVFNFDGRLIKVQTHHENNIIDLSGLTPGIYILQVQNKEKAIRAPIIISGGY
ncbi:MAG: T9SS C-terminal target domain-containing protein [Bacteroidetes bacterium]|nr:MAG: T9SS C-terminal target domain-containing protein [Bacteroidota bacterium]REK04738.1 MAG: T9SS C-terminal target domain-containing protein [Bacteroidota bacterium]REK36212.1 MAG: T9SS C-terminal target domain-containing protein [Bacteroidota bacterium]